MSPEDIDLIVNDESPELPEEEEIKKRLSRKNAAALFFAFIVTTLAVFVFFFNQKEGFQPIVKNQAKSSGLPALGGIVKNKTQKLEVIGFLPSWTPLSSVDLDGKNLTQIIYFGLGVTSDGQIIKYDAENNPVIEWGIFTSSDFRNLTKSARAKGIKVILALKNFDNASIDALISNPNATDRLARELVKLAATYKLDGFNLDFEYVTDSDYPTRIHFNKFLTTIREAFLKSNPPLTLSIDINALATKNDVAYDMPKIGELVEFLIVMGYDYHQITSSVAGPVAPLYSPGNELSVSRTIDPLNEKVAFKKIILGVPFYGYEWATFGQAWGSTTIPGSGALATYKRVRKLIDENTSVKKYWDVRSQEPWLRYMEYGVIKQIYYEDSRSIAAKVGFVRDHSMAGVAVWALGYEGAYQDIWDALKTK